MQTVPIPNACFGGFSWFSTPWHFFQWTDKDEALMERSGIIPFRTLNIHS
ncbi:MAG: hypothetical protein M0P66_06025 [Salinivirgaceae bacterium]|nr:hypothetical protein [Salinivirgaceae bacterium]